MAIYIVRVEELKYFHVKVRADNEDVAKKKASDGCGVGIDLVKENTVATVIGEYPAEILTAETIKK